jgi:predicted RNase H-like HicB family nuclease
MLIQQAGDQGEQDMKEFTLEYWKDDDWFVGRLVEIPGVFSQGETLDELKENIKDAYRMMVESETRDFLPEKMRRVELELFFLRRRDFIKKLVARGASQLPSIHLLAICFLLRAMIII